MHLCQYCGKKYKVDLMIPNKLWKKIYPNKDGSGLLCGECIIKRVEMFYSNPHIFFMCEHPAYDNE